MIQKLRSQFSRDNSKPTSATTTPYNPREEREEREREGFRHKPKRDKHQEFCNKYGIKFSSDDIIHQVCTHKSVISNTAPTNERIDYLGIK